MLRSRLNVIYPLMLISVMTISSAIYAQSTNWEGIEYGKYGVGFEVIESKDLSRTYKISGIPDLQPRPMVMGIWFPASEKGDNKSDKLEALYGIAGASAEGVSPENKKQLEEIGIPWKREEGRFPLVIYADGQNGDGYENRILCELLASHGYIVATVASKGYSSLQMPFDGAGSSAQTRDLEYVYGSMHSYPNIDMENTAAMGYSFGGLNMLSLAGNLRTIDALVALDGSITNGMSILESRDNFQTYLLEVSLLAFLGDKAPLEEFPLFENAPFSELYVLKTAGIDHFDFSSNLIELRNRPVNVRQAYSDMANRARLFMDVYLKGEKWSEEITSVTPDHIEDAKVQRVDKKPEVRKDNFIDFVTSNGADEGARVYHQTKTDFPDYELFGYRALRDVGFRLLSRGEVEEAIKIYRLLLDAFPENDDSYRRLGDALMQNGNYKESKAMLEKGLEINPDGRALNSLMQKLNELEKE